LEPSIESAQQLVVEVFVRDIARSRTFYEALGFRVIEDKGDFVALVWEEHRFFLDKRCDLPEPAALPQANMRIMVANVDHYWELAQRLGARVIDPIADRDYGIRDFTITDPDGFGLRFGAWLAGGGGGTPAVLCGT
jgi:catechol 2,3-dioxygenase-like lactoylglutathione lyase family enzyme